MSDRFDVEAEARKLARDCHKACSGGHALKAVEIAASALSRAFDAGVVSARADDCPCACHEEDPCRECCEKARALAAGEKGDETP